jgi:hypothetical protein
MNLVDPLGLFYLTCQLLGTCGGTENGGDIFLFGVGSDSHCPHLYDGGCFIGSPNGGDDNGTGRGHTSGGNSSGPTMRATPPPPPCSLQNEVTGALDFKILLGIGGHVGKFDLGAFLYKSLVTGGTGGYALAQAGKIGGVIDRPTPQGGTITGGAEPAQILVTWGPAQTNLQTGEITASKDSKWRLGGAIFGGFELDFDPKAFHEIDAQNQACRAMLKKAGFPF